MLQQLLFAWLEEQPSSPVYLHADGNYMGYAFCGNLTGDEAAAGQSLTLEGHTVCHHRSRARMARRLLRRVQYVCRRCWCVRFLSAA
jgi:hypothetical protein